MIKSSQDVCKSCGLVASSAITFIIMFMPKGRQLSAMGKEGVYAEDRTDAYTGTGSSTQSTASGATRYLINATKVIRNFHIKYMLRMYSFAAMKVEPHHPHSFLSNRWHQRKWWCHERGWPHPNRYGSTEIYLLVRKLV